MTTTNTLPTGDQLTADNAVQLLLSDVYARYPVPAHQDLFFAAAADAVFDAVSHHTALKRVAEPADVGDVAVWLCTDEARFVTGQSLLADGGYNIAGMR